MAYQSFEIDTSTEDAKEWSGEGGDFAPNVDPGEYTLEITDLQQDTSKKGNSMIVAEFTVVDGDFAGQKLKGWYALTDKAMGRIKQLQIACGARLDKIRGDELIAAKIRATVIHEPGQPQFNPDGTPKTDANGVPYEPRMFCKVLNERPLEEKPAQQVAPPPVARKGTNAAPASRRA
jgi:Protein of unknown function (DUF669)